MNRVHLFLTLVLTAWGATSYANPIAFGPYVQNMTHEEATICWSTYATSVDISSDKGTKTKRIYDQHEISFSRLEPDTEYAYDVLKDGTDLGKGTFHTFPKGIAPFKFVVYGDTRSDHTIHRKIVELAEKEDPRLVINTGDLVSSGLNIDDWEMFFEVSREFMKDRPYYPVLGNHEKNADYYFDFFSLPGNERYYEFYVGDVLFLMLDSEGSHFSMPEYARNTDKFWGNYNVEYFNKQKQWVQDMLTRHRDAGYIFVFFHSPLISIKETRVEDTKLFRAYWGDIFERNNVQAVISGHDHHYHRSQANGVQIITSGGGGAGLYDGDPKFAPESVLYKKVNHFISVDIGLKQATFKVIDTAGNEIETFTVDRRKTNYTPSAK